MRPGIFVSRTREKLGCMCDQIGRTLEPCNNPVISPQEPSGNAFPGGALYSHGRPLGGGKDTRTSHGPILLAGPSRERPPVECGVS